MDKGTSFGFRRIWPVQHQRRRRITTPPTPTPRTHDSYEGSSADRSRKFRRQPYEILDRHRDREYKLSAHNGFGQFLQYQRLSVDCGICHKPLRDTNYGNSPFDKPRRQWHHRDHWEYSTDVFG